MKKYIEKSVLEASIERISISFDIFENIYISFSGGKDSTVMLHLVMNEAIKRNRKVGLFIVDLEAQYADTIKHIQNCVKLYEKHLDIHWFCPELLLRNSVSNFTSFAFAIVPPFNYFSIYPFVILSSTFNSIK